MKMNKFSATLLCTLSFSTFSFAQKEPAPNGWHMLDKEVNGYYGISSEKAYSFIKTKDLKSKTVIVAVIDSGIDTLHEDLKPILWTNPKEIPGNGIDDDKNGYVDDVHGWNFLGGKDGRNVKEDSYEASRVYHNLSNKYIGKEPEDIDAKDKAEYEMWVKAKTNILGDVNPEEIAFIKQLYPKFLRGDSIIAKDLGKEEYNCADLKNYKPADKDANMVKSICISTCQANNIDDITNKQIFEDFDAKLKKAASADNTPKEYRKEIVGDDETNINDRNYGNNDIMTGTPMHGTHCAGIIAAVRNNGKGVDGIADNVRIMMVRAVPDGDEHDKDIANAIRYAVDNGAQVISMSFGKDFSPQKQWVDDAFRYAESKNVLLVKAAGNDAKNIDNEESYPSATYLNGKGIATNVITVGASSDPKNGGLTATFSNYGKKEVDVFSPGVRIYSTLPGGNNYGNLNGTSMACPLVAGIAALTLEYFPGLSAKQLKYVIEKSAQKPLYKLLKPGSGEMVNLSDISKTGGIVNAYEALKLAATLKGERKIQKEVLPKPKMVKSKKG